MSRPECLRDNLAGLNSFCVPPFLPANGRPTLRSSCRGFGGRSEPPTLGEKEARGVDAVELRET